MGAARPSIPDPMQDRALAPALKNHVLLENYSLPGDVEHQIEAFIEHYNHWRTLHSPGSSLSRTSRSDG